MDTLRPLLASLYQHFASPAAALPPSSPLPRSPVRGRGISPLAGSPPVANGGGGGGEWLKHRISLPMFLRMVEAAGLLRRHGEVRPRVHLPISRASPPPLARTCRSSRSHTPRISRASPASPTLCRRAVRGCPSPWCATSSSAASRRSRRAGCASRTFPRPCAAISARSAPPPASRPPPVISARSSGGPGAAPHASCGPHACAREEAPRPNQRLHGPWGQRWRRWRRRQRWLRDQPTRAVRRQPSGQAARVRADLGAVWARPRRQPTEWRRGRL